MGLWTWVWLDQHIHHSTVGLQARGCCVHHMVWQASHYHGNVYQPAPLLVVQEWPHLCVGLFISYSCSQSCCMFARVVLSSPAPDAASALLPPCCCPLQKARKLPPTWKYESSTASALVA